MMKAQDILDARATLKRAQLHFLAIHQAWVAEEAAIFEQLPAEDRSEFEEVTYLNDYVEDRVWGTTPVDQYWEINVTDIDDDEVRGYFYHRRREDSIEFRCPVELFDNFEQPLLKRFVGEQAEKISAHAQTEKEAKEARRSLEEVARIEHERKEFERLKAIYG